MIRPFATGSLLVAALALAFSVFAVVTTVRLQQRQMRHMDFEEAARLKADVHVRLEGTAQDARFIVYNVGPGAAADVNFTLDDAEGVRSPLVDGDYDRKVPIPTLLPNDHVELLALINMATGADFNGRWTWRNEDGSTLERTGVLSV